MKAATALITKFNLTAHAIEKLGYFNEMTTQMNTLNRQLKDYTLEVSMNNLDRSELNRLSTRVNLLRSQYFAIQDYIEKHTKTT